MSKVKNAYPIVNPMIVLREEFDGWAVLYDPRTGETYGLDPVGIYIWKLLDGKNSQDIILKKLEKVCKKGFPDDVPQHVADFIIELTARGLISADPLPKKIQPLLNI